MKLCTCLNCGSVFEDLNTGSESVDYPDQLLEMEGIDIPELPIIKLEDGENGYGCPTCSTDGNLSDNLNPYAGGQAAKIRIALDNFS